MLSGDGLLHARSLVPGFLLLLFSLCERILDKNPLQGGKDYLTLWFEGIIHHRPERPGLGA